MNMEMTAANKQEDPRKELLSDIDGSTEFEPAPSGVIIEDVAQLGILVGEPEIAESRNGLESDANNPDLPYNHERNHVVYAGAHANETGVITEGVALLKISIGELEIKSSNGLRSDSVNSDLPHNLERDQVGCSGTHVNETGVITVDLPQLLRPIGESEIVVSKFVNGLESDDENPRLPQNHQCNQEVYLGTHNKDSEITTAFEQECLVKRFLSDIKESPEIEFVASQCCIYKVPITIRSVQEKLYTPKLISIGPFHHGKPELADMEKKKRQYAKSFFSRTTPEKIDKIISFIKGNEKMIRACYAEASPLGSCQFVMMILYDSLFIIEIFLREAIRLFTEANEDGCDVLLETGPLNLALGADLQLFENQLPYFVLDKIYELVFAGIFGVPFQHFSFVFFPSFLEVESSLSTPEGGVKHFTDWIRMSLLENYPKSLLGEECRGWVRDLPCAVKLHESGVKFKGIPIKVGDSLFDIKFEKRKRLLPFFEVYELQIPQLNIFDMTELTLRNIIALEQCIYPNNALICNYVQLMDLLINTVEDVDFLVGNQIVGDAIISNHMGDSASVADMFNKLNQHIIEKKSPYYGICEQLKKHYNNRWNRATATLKRVYFSNPWRGTATVAGVSLVFLTIVGTVCSILQVLF